MARSSLFFWLFAHVPIVVAFVLAVLWLEGGGPAWLNEPVFFVGAGIGLILAGWLLVPWYRGS